MDAGFGRGMEVGVGRPPDWLMPNGLLPPRTGGRGLAPGRGAVGAPPAGVGRGPAGPGRGGAVPVPVPGPAAVPSVGACRRAVSRCRAACCAALTAASCSALSAAARASAAATSMSWALAGLTGGAAGRGGPGSGPRRSTVGAFLGGGGVGRAMVLGGVAGALPSAGAGAGALATGAGAAAASKEARSRRATGASTVLDADLTYSPSSWSFARTVLLSTPSSFASSCTRALPATALLTLRPAAEPAYRPHSCT
jgi:hypothetical protein